MSKRILMIVCTLALICVLGFGYGGVAKASTIPQFPQQSKNSYSKSYTRGLQVMLLHTSDSISKTIRQNGGADGIYGDGTYSAVVKYQRTKNLLGDGICGANTWTCLNADLKMRNSTSNTYLYYDGKYNYSSTKNTMRRKISTGVWYCYYGSWYKVG